MRKILLSCLLALFVNTLSAQESTDIECAHARSASTLLQTNTSVNQNAAFDDYDVKFYFLEIEASDASVYLKSKVSITAQVVSNALSQFVVLLDDALTVDSVWVYNIPANFTHSNGEVIVDLNSPLAANDIFSVTFFYHGFPPTGGFFSGISSAFISGTQGPRVTWTLSEPLNAKDWFPCKQVLTDKADSAWIFLTVPNHLKAGSNGLLTDIVPLENNRHRFEWKTNYPIAYYLLSLSIANYQEYVNYAHPAGSDPIMIQTYLYNDAATLNASKAVLDQVPAMIELFSEKYGLYPFHEEKYGHCTAPLGGAMEHQTMSTMTNFGFGVTAHELGHQWFGDNVTCGTWRDIWVNEGFARYSEYLAYEFLQSKSNADSWRLSIYENVLSLPAGSVYVPESSATDPNRIFSTRLTYNKGSALIHMIRKIVNDDDVFFDLLRTYQSEFARKVAKADDFRELLEFKSGMDFEEFFEDWFYGEGYPIYEIEWNHFNDSLFIKQKQLTSHASVDFFDTPLDYFIRSNAGDLTLRITPTQNEESFQFYMPSPVYQIVPDLEGWLLKKVTKLVRNKSLRGNAVVTDTDPEVLSSFSVYPNPATGKVTVSHAGNQPFNFVLTDLNGRQLFYQNNVYQKTDINLGEIGQGLYILQIAVNGKLHTRKLKIE